MEDAMANDPVKVSPEMLQAFINLAAKCRDACVILGEMIDNNHNEYSSEERAKNAKAIAYWTQSIERHQAELAELKENGAAE